MIEKDETSYNTKNKVMKFGILITARNNEYSMVEEWIGLYDYSGISILNLDLNSDEELRLKGKKICKKHGIVFKDCNSINLEDNILQAFQYFYEEEGIEWLLYMHHDAYPMLENTLTQLNDILLNSSKIQDFGVVGFNVYQNQFELSQFDPNKQQLMTTARAPLELGNGYYDSRVESRVDYKKFEFKPFAVENVNASTALINYHQFNKYITIDPEFTFFNAWDDVAFQFLSHNVYNIVIPSLSFAHEPSLKVKHGIPFSSPNIDKKIMKKIYGTTDYQSIWRKKWGFDYSMSKCVFGGDSFINKNHFINKVIVRISKLIQYDFVSSLNTVARKGYSSQYGKNNNLLDDFYEHDPKNGPLKYFDI